MSLSSGLYLRQASLPLHLPKDIRRKRLKLYTIPSLLSSLSSLLRFFSKKEPAFNVHVTNIKHTLDKTK